MIVLGVIVILLVVGLCGCNEITGDTDKVELVSYNVEKQSPIGDETEFYRVY